MGSYRLRLGGRLLVVLSGVAAFSTILALTLHERALSADLERAAADRLANAARAADLLVTHHLESVRQRYQAISGTPQLRANLEVGDGPTLRFYAEELRSREGALAIVFMDRHDRPLAVAAPDPTLAAAVAPVREAALLDHRGFALAVASVPLRTGGATLGRLVAVEAIDAVQLALWSDLCGARVGLRRIGDREGDELRTAVRTLSDLELEVALSLQAEREALSNSRASLLAVGAIALGLALALSFGVSRSLVRPIEAIQHAAIRIADGDFSPRLASSRGDEIGDVARAFDGMLDRLRAYRSQVERQRDELEQSVEQLRQSEEQLAHAQELAHIGSWQFDLSRNELSGSQEFWRIFGRGEGEKPLDPRDLLEAVHADDREALETTLRECVEERSALRCDCRVELPDRPGRVVHIHAQFRDESPVLSGTVQDVTERKRSEEQIRYLAYHDSLTGLGNRLHCKERLHIALSQARRDEQPLGVLFLDLDRFKRINDTLGHTAGDELLKGVADRLVASVRESDYVGRSRQGSRAISRLGGDEFTVIIPELRDVQDLARVARRILAALATPFELDGHEVVISGSIGITAFPFDAEDVDGLLRNADAAMYHAKEQGRNNYQFFAESMNELAMQRLVMESKMRRALEASEFELHYQPKVCLDTGRLAGVEALLRWREPDSGLVPPGVFVPIAEETGLIGRLGEWVIREACRQSVEWQRAGTPHPIAVNLSTHQFRTGDLPDRILGVLRETGADPSLIELEITESTLMHDESAVVEDLQVLRAAGMRIAVDDFGTGYSSFGYLRRLPVDALKIDRSFIEGIERDEEGAALVASIIAMGHALRLEVIAEGVEAQGQRELLTSWGCDQLQGFLVSRAIPASGLARLLGPDVTV